MAKNSSTNRAAKLAQQSGGGPSLRFQGGTIFPLAIALTLIIGVGLIVYGRATLPEADASPPTIDDHWHAAYGFYLCDTWYQLDGALEELNAAGTGFSNNTFARTGVHSHNDGIIHWHAYTSAAVGNRANLGVFLEGYDVKLSDDKIEFPENNILGGEQVWEEGETQCDGEDAEVSVVVWDNFADTDNGTRYIANMNNIRIDQDQMVFGIYFTSADADQVKPPWSPELPALGSVDNAQVTPEDLAPTTVPTTGPGGSTVPGGSTLPATDTVAPDTGAPADDGTVAPASTEPADTDS